MSDEQKAANKAQMASHYIEQYKSLAESELAETSGCVWRSISKSHPADMQRVICKYNGVYDERLVTFWRDAGGNPHFGLPSESDGKGSQPATHWMPLP